MTPNLHYGAVGDISAADLYGEIEAPRTLTVRDHLPGLAVAIIATLAAGFLADRYGAPLTLMGLLIGLALNFLSGDKRLTPGLQFCSRALLRGGIVLIGARVTLLQILQLGPVALLAVALIVAAVLLSGPILARRLRLDGNFGILAAGAVAICGASAAMAFATLLGERRVSRGQLTLVLVGISSMSAAAMVLYPLIAHALGLGDHQAGFLFGAAIHDVAQSLGAGYSFSPIAGQTAAIVKLTRVALLAPALAIVSLTLRGEGSRGTSAPALPWFVTGFLIVAAVNSTGVIPALAADGAQKLATGLLACAVTSTGISSPMRSLMQTGWRPLLVILGATLLSLALSLAGATLLVPATL